MRHNLWYAGITVVSRALHYCSWMEVEIWHLQDTANLWIELYSKMFFLDEFAICNMMLNIKGLAPEMHQIRENICHIGWEKLFFCVITCCVTIACFPSYNFNCYLTIRIRIRYIKCQYDRKKVKISWYVIDTRYEIYKSISKYKGLFL